MTGYWPMTSMRCIYVFDYERIRISRNDKHMFSSVLWRLIEQWPRTCWEPQHSRTSKRDQLIAHDDPRGTIWSVCYGRLPHKSVRVITHDDSREILGGQGFLVSANRCTCQCMYIATYRPVGHGFVLCLFLQKDMPHAFSFWKSR